MMALNRGFKTEHKKVIVVQYCNHSKNMSKYLPLMLESSSVMKEEVVIHDSLDGVPVERSNMRSNNAPQKRRMSK